AHDALEHHAAGDLDLFVNFNQRVLVKLVVRGVQRRRDIVGAEIIGVGYALGAQFGQFATALGNQVVFVGGNTGWRRFVHESCRLSVISDVIEHIRAEVVVGNIAQNAGSHV